MKYPSGDQIEELVKSQFVARLCLVAAIMHQPEARSLVSTDKGLQLSRTLMFPMDETLEAAKCVELEKIIVDDDSEKFF